MSPSTVHYYQLFAPPPPPRPTWIARFLDGRRRLQLWDIRFLIMSYVGMVIAILCLLVFDVVVNSDDDYTGNLHVAVFGIGMAFCLCASFADYLMISERLTVRVINTLKPIEVEGEDEYRRYLVKGWLLYSLYILYMSVIINGAYTLAILVEMVILPVAGYRLACISAVEYYHPGSVFQSAVKCTLFCFAHLFAVYLVGAGGYILTPL